jgi:methyltransferase (TIGR00027 family)
MEVEYSTQRCVDGQSHLANRKRVRMGAATQLSDVSRTAIATLRCRVIESQKECPLMRDPMAVSCLERLAGIASPREKALLFERSLSPALILYIVLRARKYDAVTSKFLGENPSGLVVNLGCGFDTRYWRIHADRSQYVELDLPEVIELKRIILGERLEYRTIGASVLDFSWMDMVNPEGIRPTLLLAEGLFMYLPKALVISLFSKMTERFRHSYVAFEVVSEKYTRGFWKRVAAWKIRRQLGYDAGSSYSFGVRSAREVESFGDGLKVVSEWSYLDEPDVRPRILRYLGISRTQWTVIASIAGHSDDGHGSAARGTGR